MKMPLQISVPKPCHENWAAMTPVDKARFCASCQKKIRDFTRATDREILEALKTGGPACGRFRASQLNRDLAVPEEKSKLWSAASAAVIAFLTLGMNEISAQTHPSAEKQGDKTGYTDDKGDFTTPHRVTIGDTQEDFRGAIRMIKGAVTDEEAFPIPGATVKVMATGKNVQTDFDGLFSIEAKPGDTLVFMMLGMQINKTKISEETELKIILQEDTAVVEDVVVGSYSSEGDGYLGVARRFKFNY